MDVLKGRMKRRRPVIQSGTTPPAHPFARELTGLLESEPVEDGVSHPAERFLEDNLNTDRLPATEWIQTLYNGYLNKRPAMAADIMRCVGRLSPSIAGEWALNMAERGLDHSNIEVRDAAVRAFELWGSLGSLDLLKAHADTEPLPWLADSIRGVIADLSKLSTIEVLK